MIPFHFLFRRFDLLMDKMVPFYFIFRRVDIIAEMIPSISYLGKIDMIPFYDTQNDILLFHVQGISSPRSQIDPFPNRIQAIRPAHSQIDPFQFPIQGIRPIHSQNDTLPFFHIQGISSG